MFPVILLGIVTVFVNISEILGTSSSSGGTESFCRIAILCRTAVAIIIPVIIKNHVSTDTSTKYKY